LCMRIALCHYFDKLSLSVGLTLIHEMLLSREKEKLDYEWNCWIKIV
jgi:hypothetical protein